MTDYSATYSPEDNKLRLYASQRLDPETYARVKAAGFAWAPKQDLFVAPMWTTVREDLCLELAGEIGDEDTSLVERAAERAERFEDYSAARLEDAEHARAAVSAIADNIPMGQPILVGHHSERHARKDAERIQNGMQRAVNAWRTSQYWTDRAAGAIRHAKYKERPDVRARRIKKIEAEERKTRKNRDHCAKLLKAWGTPNMTRELALMIANRADQGGLTLPDGTSHWSAWSALNDNLVTVEYLQARRLENLPKVIAQQDRWLEHYANRLAYERALLADAGGTVTDRTGPEKGGACRCWCSPRGGWSYIVRVNKVSVTVLDNWGNGGDHFTRTIPFDKLASVMTLAQVEEARQAGRVLDGPPDGTGRVQGFLLRSTVPPEPYSALLGAPVPPEPTQPTEPAPFEAMAETLKAGVQVVTAPDLFPTPPDLARRMVELAELEDGQRVLEPSAGTGRLVWPILRALAPSGQVVAVELNHHLAEGLRAEHRRLVNSIHANMEDIDVRCSDFLSCNGDLGQFDRIVMNPPFSGGADIKHIRHALAFLKPGGRLVALCANGPRQTAALQPLADSWEELPAGTFDGTEVRAVLLTITP